MEDLILSETTEATINEIDHQARLLAERIKQGLSDPAHMMSISDIERAISSTKANTNEMYLKMVSQIINDTDEGAVIKLKKPNTERKE